MAYRDLKAVVIDDEPDTAMYLSNILEESQFSVRTAHNVSDGERLIREDVPDVILLDLMMPGRTGIQLFIRLKGDDEMKKIPIVMVTGIRQETSYDWKDIVERSKVRSPEGFVEKPVNPDELMRVIDDILVYAKGNNIVEEKRA